ncbi:hypothetical protein L1887_01888 [Cichorium endivia]|nr:hypothetical protein L1887_01888 [Cichorium endivia]
MCTLDVKTNIKPVEKGVLEGHVCIALEDILNCFKTYVFPYHLLKMQFPSSGLTLLEDDFTVDLLTTMSKNGHNHGDIKFASSLGPLQFDNSATVDSFFEAFLHRSKEDHMMIHELGLLLGIVVFYDHCTCFSESKESLKRFSSEDEVISTSLEVNTNDCKRDGVKTRRVQSGVGSFIRPMSDSERENDAATIIESIRIEEFFLDPNISSTKDSHFLLELVQNADDNVYPRNVEPTLTFILEEKSIVVMNINNEVGFSGEEHQSAL